MNAPANLSAEAIATRHDGWTPERRRTFLELLAEGHTVDAACGHVGKSRVTAYALRRRDGGFALAWSAAVLKARDAVADTLTSRAIDGQVDVLTRADGSTVTRHRYDNRLGLALLARLDRLAAQPVTSELGQPDEAAMRAAAHAFDALVDLVGQGDLDGDAVAAFIEPHIRKLRELCRGEGMVAREEDDEEASEIDGDEEAVEDAEDGGPPSSVADLDPPGDAVAAAEHRETRALCKLRSDDPNADPPEDPPVVAETATPRIWYRSGYDQYHTDLPPPDGFRGYQHGRYGQDGFWRVLSPAELARHQQRERDDSG